MPASYENLTALVTRLERRLEHQPPAPGRSRLLSALPFLEAMTAKEQLRERIEALSEDEASEALRLLDLRTDPAIAAFRDAPVDDEPWTEDDEAAAAEGRADIAAGAHRRVSRRPSAHDHRHTRPAARARLPRLTAPRRISGVPGNPR